MNSQTRTPTDAPAPEPEPEPAPAPEYLVAGPAGTKVLLPPTAARAIKARGHAHGGLKVFPPLPATDAADAEEDKPDAA